MARTSLSDPLQVGEVTCASGVIGMTLCPGKKGASVYGAPWDRDLDLDMAAIASWKPDVVVTLMESHEFAGLAVPDLPARLSALGPLWFHLPIRDLGVPDDRFERRWAYFGHILRKRLREGGRVLIHCRGGLGRTGLLAARLLVEFGWDPREAISAIREARPGAIETREQEIHVEGIDPTWIDVAATDRIIGCLVGGAIGDAFGYAVEFQSWSQIAARHGPAGLQQPVLRNGRLEVSDDTQMTLFTAEGLLAAVGPHGAVRVEQVVPKVREAYLQWLQTQSEEPGYGARGLARYTELWRAQAPGNTCLSALRQGGNGTPDDPVNDSKGCGGVMRVAPLGLLRRLTAEEAFSLADQAAALTHGHPCGRLSAAGLAALVHDLAGGALLPEALDAMLARLDALQEGRDTARAVRTAITAAGKGAATPERIHAIGGGWVGEEALAIAVYAVLKGETLIDVLRIAINHDGDSDSTGSIAGQIWGAMHGMDEAMDTWGPKLDVLDPLCDVIAGLVASLDAEPQDRLAARLQALARNRQRQAAPDVPETHPGSNDYSHVSELILDLCDAGWVAPFDWLQWQGSRECGRMFAEPGAIGLASPAQLSRLLTALVRKDRFVEGQFEWAVQTGLLARAAERAATIHAALGGPPT